MALSSSIQQSTRITIQTDEGDIVTFSGMLQNHQGLQAREWLTPMSSGQSMSSFSSRSETMAVSLKGDLNPQELADIANLITDLTAIASSFFTGDYGKAMQDALEIGDMGSLSAMSASFSQRISQQTRITGTHPIPASFDDMAESLRRELPQTETDGEGGRTSYSAQMKARWQQILTALAEGEPEKPPPTKEASAVGTKEEAALRMFSRWQQALENNPGLSPFIGPLTEKAMVRASAHQPAGQHPATAKGYSDLRQAFQRQHDNWLHANTLPEKPGQTVNI
ncbi:hypothetical protein ACUUL3_06610 [Thiovibrio sp. JS02]